MTADPQQVNVLELLKIPQSQHKPETINLIKTRRSFLADTFFDKSKPAEERNKLITELNTINKYFGYKEVFEIKVDGKGGGQVYSASESQRKQNCDSLINYLKSITEQVTPSVKMTLWEKLPPVEQAKIIAMTWGSWKQ